MQSRREPRGCSKGIADLASHKRSAAEREHVVELDAVAGIHTFGLAIVHRDLDFDLISVKILKYLTNARIEGGLLLLLHLQHQSGKLAGAGSLDPSFCCGLHQQHLADGKGAEGIKINYIHRKLKY